MRTVNRAEVYERKRPVNIRQKSDHLIVVMKRVKACGAKGMASQ